MGEITERNRAHQALREREEELEIKTSNLEEANTALRVLQKRKTDDNAELQAKVFFNVRELVMPLLEKLERPDWIRDNRSTYVAWNRI